jgi:hypothetical protein
MNGTELRDSTNLGWLNYQLLRKTVVDDVSTVTYKKFGTFYLPLGSQMLHKKTH